MAVGKGSIQRAKRTLTDENTEKAVFTETKDASVVERTSEADSFVAEAAEKQPEEAPAVEAESVKKTPARRGRKPGSKNKKTLAAETEATAETAKSTSAKAGQQPAKRRGRPKKSEAQEAEAVVKTISKTAGSAAKPTRKVQTSRKMTKASQTDTAKEEKKKYTQVSHIHSDLPVHLL